MPKGKCGEEITARNSQIGIWVLRCAKVPNLEGHVFEKDLDTAVETHCEECLSKPWHKSWRRA